MWQIKYLLPGAALLSFSIVLANDQQPLLFNASYKLYSSGIEIAVSQRTMSNSHDNKYVYRNVSHTTGIASLFYKDHIVEESQWKFANDQLYPLDYSYVRTRGKKDREVNIHFDWENNLIINRVNDRTRKMQLESGVLDKLLYQYAIMRDLQNGYFPGSYTIADGGKMKTYNFEQLGEETIYTPLGDLHTIKVLRYKPDDSTQNKLIFWCAPGFQYLPVKIEQTEEDGQIITAVIESLSWL
ncbi:MAG: DUF3108 domain-containing protein [Gammaproteobacteria bacterium]|nr:DUF3108 domain-containing protein [Gammaproteobacteria bacterium]